MPSWIRRIGTSIAGSLAGEFIKTWVWPLFPTAIAVIVGWLEGVSVFYLFVGGAVLFASVSVGLLHFSLWKAMNRVEDKLTLLRVRQQPIFHPAENVIRELRFGFTLNNSAPYPIQFKIKDLRTILTLDGVPDSIYSPNIEREDKVYTIEPQTTCSFDDYSLPVPKNFFGAARVQIHSRLSYGRGGRLDYSLQLQKMAIFSFQDIRNLRGIAWYDE